MSVPALHVPSLPLAGGCQCGAVRYTISRAPIVFYLCHCSECQKQSSSAFGESLRVETAGFGIAGETRVFERPTARGGLMQCRFCPACGTRLTHERPDRTDRLNVKAGTLDATAWLMPAGHIWTASKQALSVIAPDALAYPHQPESDAALEARWRAMTPGWGAQRSG